MARTKKGAKPVKKGCCRGCSRPLAGLKLTVTETVSGGVWCSIFCCLGVAVPEGHHEKGTGRGGD